MDGRPVTLKTTIIFDAETFDGYPIQFRWEPDSLTINVFTGLRDSINDPLEDEIEIDAITIGKPELAAARWACNYWLDSKRWPEALPR